MLQVNLVTTELGWSVAIREGVVQLDQRMEIKYIFQICKLNIFHDYKSYLILFEIFLFIYFIIDSSWFNKAQLRTVHISEAFWLAEESCTCCPSIRSWIYQHSQSHWQAGKKNWLLGKQIHIAANSIKVKKICSENIYTSFLFLHNNNLNLPLCFYIHT